MDAATRAEWRRRIEEMDPSDPEERLCRPRFVEALDAPGDLFSRSTFDPGHFTASLFCLLAPASAVLLVRHAWLGGGRWLQPGGHVEPSDATLETTALRELSEETGIQQDFLFNPPRFLDLDVHDVPAHGREPAHLHFDVRFCLVLGPDTAPSTPDAAWFKLDRGLLPGAVPTDDSVRRALRRARRRGWL